MGGSEAEWLVMAAYRRVYDSRHLQADCKNRDQLRNRTLGNRVWATFAFLLLELVVCSSVINFRYTCAKYKVTKPLPLSQTSRSRS